MGSGSSTNQMLAASAASTSAATSLNTPHDSPRKQSVSAATSQRMASSSVRGTPIITPSSKSDSTNTISTANTGYGLKLAYWNEFLQHSGGKERFHGMSTRQVCEEIIMPLTGGEEISYCQLLLKQGHPAVGHAQVYIIHDSRFEFLHVVDSLLDHFQDNSNIIVWFDIFSVNYHQTEEKNLIYWRNVFMPEITNIGYSVLVLPPLQEQTTKAFECITCLFALYTSMVSKCKFEIALKKDDALKLIEDLTHETQATLQQIQSNIDILHAKAMNSDVKKAIFNFLEEEAIGFVQFNHLVYRRVREWITQYLSDVFDQSSITSPSMRSTKRMPICRSITFDKLASLYIQIAVASLLVEARKFDIALGMYEDAQMRIFAEYGEAHPIALRCLFGIASLFSVSGRCEEAERSFLDCIDLCKHSLGKDHPDALKYTAALGELYGKQGENKKAEACYQHCLQRHGKIYGEQHPDRIQYMHKLALLYDQLLKDQQAQEVLNDCLQRAKAHYGIKNAETIKIMGSLAQVYTGRGKYDQALSLERECYQHSLEVLGQYHVDTLAIMMHISKLYDIMEQYHEALTMYQNCIETSKKLLGEKHPYAQSLQRSLGAVEKKMHPHHHHHHEQHSSPNKHQDNHTKDISSSPQRRILLLSTPSK